MGLGGAPRAHTLTRALDATLEFEVVMFAQIIKMLRERPDTRTSTIVAIIEADYSPHNVKGFAREARRHRNVVVMQEFKGDPNRDGVMKQQNGAMYQQALAILLRTGRVHIAETGEFGEDGPDGPVKLVELYAQMRAFERVPKGRSSSGAIKYEWKGKHHDKDDIIVALQQAVFYMLIYLASARYTRVRGSGPITLDGLGTIRAVLTELSENREPSPKRRRVGF